MVDSEAIANLEGNTAFDVEWRRSRGKVTPGFTAVLRVKNEARNMPYVLPSLLRSVASVIVIDNGSTDGTLDIAREVADQLDMSRKLTVMEYPFVVSRCGSEHLHTPPDSVHSLTYFYNWSFSHVETSYALKWDGDMVLTGEGEQIVRDLSWQLEATDVRVYIPRHSVYVTSDAVAYLDTGLRNREPWGWPNKPGFTFGKGFEWEIPLQPPAPVTSVFLPQFICFELKWLDLNEFDHWSPHDFERSGRTGRKNREMEVFAGLQRGVVAPDLLRIEREGTEHVVDTITQRSSAVWDRMVLGSHVPARGVL